MTLFTQKITATILTGVLIGSFIGLSQTSIQAQQADGLYIGISSTIRGVPTHPGADRATAYTTAINLVAGTTTYILQRGNGDYTISGVISGPGDLVVNIGAGNILTLTRDNTYTGTTTVESGRLKIEQGASAITVKNRATLELYGTTFREHFFPLTLEDGSTLVKSNKSSNIFDGHDITVNGAVEIEITNSPKIVHHDHLTILNNAALRGSGTVTIDNSMGNAYTGLSILDADPDHFNGTIIFRDGTLLIGDPKASLALDSTSLQLEGSAVFDIVYVNVSLKSLNGGPGTKVELRDRTLTLGTDNGKSNYAGLIRGFGALKKVGTDTVTLSGANIYSGATQVEKGVLKVSGSLVSGVTIDGGKLIGKGKVSSATLKSASGSALYGGSGPGNADTLTVSGGAFTGQDGTLEVYSLGSSVSTVRATRTSGNLTVNLKEPITATNTPTTLTLIQCADATSTMEAMMGTNNSGHNNVRLKWTAGTGLQVILGEAVGLYRDDMLVGNLSTAIALDKNSVFTETKGANSVTYELSGIISGPHGIETQVETLILSANNTYTGTTTITSGTLQIGNGTGSGSIGAGAVTNNGTLIFNRTGDVDWTQAISGRGALTKRGTDVLTLSGALSYTGPTTVAEGRLKIEDGTSTITVQNGATLELFGTTDRDHSFPLTLEGGSTLLKSNSGKNTFDSHDVTVNGTVEIDITSNQLDIGSGTTGLRGSGTDTLTLDNANASTGLTLRGTGPDHFKGTLIIQNGQLDISHSNAALALDSTSLRLEGSAVFDVDTEVSVKSLNGVAGTEVQLGTRHDTLTLGTDNGKSNYAGVIRGSGAVKKVGSDTVTLSGVNTYTGPTRIKEGVLELVKGSSLSSASSVTIEGGALGGAGTVNRSITLKATPGSAIYGGSGPDNADTLTIRGTVTAADGVLKVYSSANRSRVSVVTVRGAARGHLVVNLEQAINANNTPYTIISSPNRRFALFGVLGTNNSGHPARVKWVAGTGLQVTVGGTVGLYQDETLLTTTSPYSSNIGLLRNSVFTETKGANSVTYELSGVISGNTFGIETQVDSLILSEDNTYTGNTKVSIGVLQIGNGGTRGTLGTSAGTVRVEPGAVLHFKRSNNITVGNVINGSGTLVQNGTDTLTLTGVNVYGGAVEIRSGSLQVGDGGRSGDIGSGDISIRRGARLIYNRSRDLEWDNEISGLGSIVKCGTGTLTLSLIPISYSGTATVKAGKLKIRNWTSPITVKSGATLELYGITNRAHRFPLTLEDGSTLLKSNQGYNILNTHDVIVNGAVEIEITNSPGGILNNQQLYIGGGREDRRTGLRGSGTLTIDNTRGSALTGLILWGTGPDHFNGTIVVQGGKLSIGDLGRGSFAGTALDRASVRLERSAKLRVIAPNALVKSLDGEAGTEVQLVGSRTLTLGTNDGSGSYAGVISDNFWRGPGQIKKVGSGTQTLTGINTYTGTTRVEGGILELGSGGSLEARSAVTVAGGTLRGEGTVNGNVTLTATPGSAIYGGSGMGNTDTLTIGGTLTGEDGALDVYVSGSNVSTVTAGAATGRVVVNLREAITLTGGQTATLTLISCIDQNSAMTARIGINSSGHRTRLIWTDGTGLQVILGSTPAGLYRDGISLTTSTTHTGDITLVQNSVFTEIVGTTNVTHELSGIISGGGFGIDSQVDSLILTGENTYTGATRVSFGVLQIGKGGTVGQLGLGAVMVEPSTILQFQRRDDITVANVIAGPGTLVQAGRGKLILTGTNTHSGKKEIRSGSLQVGNGGRVGALGTGEVSISSGASLIYNRSDNVSWTNTVSGPGSIVKKGTGTLTLTATPTNYSGTVTVETGRLKIQDWPSAMTTVKSGATLELSGTTDRDHRFPMTLEGGSTLLKSNSGYNMFNNHDITVNGQVKIEITNNPSVANNQQLYIGSIGAGFIGSGTVTIDNNGGNTHTGLTLRGTNLEDHFNGILVVRGGRLGLGDIRGKLVAGRALDSTSVRLENGAQFLISGAPSTTAVDASVKSLDGVAGTSVQLGAQTLTLGTDNGKSSYAGVISGAGGALKKVGVDTVTLSGANTYTGTTRVEKGVLKVSGSLASAVMVDGGKLMGTGTVSSVTLKGTAGSALSGGTGPGNADTLKISGMLTAERGGKLDVYASGSGASLQLSVVKADRATGEVTVNLKEAITRGQGQTLTLIKCADRTSSMTSKIGINRSTQNVRIKWTSGEGLQVILGKVAGLYKDNELLTAKATHTENIVLTENSVFTEVVGSTHITHELSGTISGAGGIENQVDTLILTGENSYTGTTKVSSGVLQIGKGGAGGKLGPGPVTLSSVNSELLYQHGGSAHTVANSIGGAGKLTQAGTDTLILTGAHTYRGASRVQQGVLRVSGALWNSSVTIAGGALCGTGTVKSVTLNSTAGSALFGGNGPGHADTLTISGILTGSGGALNVYSSGSGASTKTSHVKAHSVSGNLVVNIEGDLPIGTYTLISCTDTRSRLTPTLGRNLSEGCVALSWQRGEGLRAVVSASTLLATIAGGGTAEKGSTPEPKVIFTGNGGISPYTFTYKIGQGAEQTISSTATSSVAELTVPTSTIATLVYTLVRVRDSSTEHCDRSVTGGQATVTITPVTGDLPKPGESLHVYPIPAQDQIVIRSAKVLGRIQLRDLQGRVLIEREPSSSQELELSIADLPPGIYIVEVEVGQNLRRVKLSKE